MRATSRRFKQLGLVVALLSCCFTASAQAQFDTLIQGLIGASVQQGHRQQTQQALPPAQRPQPYDSQRQPSAGPSFNCAGRRNPVEVAICSDPELAQLDRQMADAFIGRMRSGADLQQLKADQARWRAKRDLCTARACVKSAMMARTEELGGITQAPTLATDPLADASRDAATADSDGLQLPRLPQFDNMALMGGGASSRDEGKWFLLAQLAVDPGQLDQNPEGFAYAFLSERNALANRAAWHSTNEFRAADARREFLSKYAPALRKAAARLPVRFANLETVSFETYDQGRQGFALKITQGEVPRSLSASGIPVSGDLSIPDDFWPVSEARARSLFEASRELSEHKVTLVTEIELAASDAQPGALLGRWVHAYLLDPATKRVIHDFGAAPARPLAIAPQGASAPNPFVAWPHPPAGFKTWSFTTLEGAVAFNDPKLLMLMIAAGHQPDFFNRPNVYSERRYLEQAMLSAATLDAIYDAGSTLRGVNEFERARSAEKLQALYPSLAALAPRLPFDVTLMRRTMLPEYNMARKGFVISAGEDFGLRSSAQESGLTLATAFAWPEVFWPIDPEHAEAVWKAVGPDRRIDLAGHITVDSVDPASGRVTLKLQAVALYKPGARQLLYRIPIGSDQLSQSEQPGRMVARTPVALNQTLLCAELLGMGASLTDRQIADCRGDLERRDATTYANPERLAHLALTDPDYPFFPRSGLPSGPDATAKLRAWGRAYAAAAAGGTVASSGSRLSERSAGGMTYYAAGSASTPNGEQWSRLLEKRRLRPEQITSFGEVGALPVILLLPNLASSYKAFVPDGQLNHDSDGGATPTALLKLEAAQMVQDNNGKDYLALTVRPVSLTVTSRTGGSVIVTRDFADVPAFASDAGRRDSTGPIPLESATIDLLSVKTANGALPPEALAYMIKRRWEYERSQVGPIDRYFPIGQPVPSVDAIAAQTGDFATWAASHAPALPLDIQIGTTLDVVKAQGTIPWRTFDCIDSLGSPPLIANDYAPRAAYERLLCQGRQNSGDDQAQANCATLGRLLAKSDLLHEVGGTCRRRNVSLNFTDPLSVFAHFDKEVPAPVVSALGGKETVKIGATLRLVSVTGSSEDPREQLFAGAPLNGRNGEPAKQSRFFSNLELQLVGSSYNDARTGAALAAQPGDVAADAAQAPDAGVAPPRSAGDGLDLVGIRLGMPFDAAEAIIREHMKVGSVLEGARAVDEQAKRGFIKPVTSGKLFVSEDGRELIALIDEPPAAADRVMLAWRRVYVPDGTIMPEEIAADLKKKYGEPSREAHDLSASAHWSTPSGRQCYAFYGGTHSEPLAAGWSKDGVPAQIPSSNPRGMNAPGLLSALFDPLSERVAQWKTCGPYVTASFHQSNGLAGPMDELDMTLTDFGRYSDAYGASRQQAIQQNPSAATQAHVKF